MPLLKEPAITVGGVRVRALTLSAIDLDVTLNITNPNLFGVTLRDLPFAVLCTTDSGEQQIATGNPGCVKIRGNCSTVLTVPVTAHHAGMLGAITSFVTWGGTDVTIRGIAVVDCVVTCRPVPFTKSIRLTHRQLTGAISGAVARKEE
jgi:LEA14-like dessication related protein